MKRRDLPGYGLSPRNKTDDEQSKQPIQSKQDKEHKEDDEEGKSEDLIFQAFNWLASKPKRSLQEDEDPDDEFTMHCFGITEVGQSVCVQIDGFMPFFYISLGKVWYPRWTRIFINQLKSLADNPKGDLVKWQVCNRILFNEYTNEEKRPFMCLIFDTIDAFYTYRRLFYKKIRVQGINNGYPRQYDLCESGLPPTMRYLHIQNLDPLGWIRLKKSDLKKTNDSTCEISCKVKWENVHPMEKEGYAPILQASFDIECTSESGNFPQADNEFDKVVQICTTFRWFGSEKGEYALQHRIVLGDYPDESNNELVVCKTEEDVLMAWQQLIMNIDPDIIIGYNITGFDMEYLVERARLLGCYDEFMNMSRISHRNTYLESGGITTSAKGENTFKVLNMPGRIAMDLLKIIRWEYKLVSYKLDSVGQEFLNAGKDPVTPRDIFDAYQEDMEITEEVLANRKRICDYCIQDCALVQDLCDTLCLLLNNMQMGAVCSTPLHDILYRGQGIKLFSLVCKYCKERGYIMKENKKMEGNNR
jgi:DNA polymerase delta subunit 1